MLLLIFFDIINAYTRLDIERRMVLDRSAGSQVFVVSYPKIIPDETFGSLLTYAEADKRDRLQRMKREKAQASLIGLLLAKYAIAQKWRLPFYDIQFGTTSYGKPYVIGHEQVHFNISHSGTVCVCVVADAPVGVDIQKMEPHNFHRIVKRFFTAEEQAVYEQEGRGKLAFYRMWTKRESVGKYLGMGFYYKNHKDTADWQVFHTIYQHTYMLCVCTRAE